MDVHDRLLATICFSAFLFACSEPSTPEAIAVAATPAPRTAKPSEALAYYEKGDYFHAILEWNRYAPPSSEILAMADSLDRIGYLDEAVALLALHEQECVQHPGELFCARLPDMRARMGSKLRANLQWAGLERVDARTAKPWRPIYAERKIASDATSLVLVSQPRGRFYGEDTVTSGYSGTKSVDVTRHGRDRSYWLRISNDEGRTFDGPHFLGLVESGPYIVVSSSEIRLSETEVQIEVARSLDPGARPGLTPPSPLYDSRLFLTFSRATIRKDSDRDGLTDVYEEWLTLDPESADTDGDGLGDARDPQPIAPLGEASAMGEPLFEALVQEFLGNPIRSLAKDRTESLPPQGVLLVSAPGPLGGNYDLPARTVVLPADSMSALRKKFSAPLGYEIWLGPPTVSPDKTEMLFPYSTSWEGGVIYTKRSAAGAWQTGKFVHWIQ